MAVSFSTNSLNTYWEQIKKAAASPAAVVAARALSPALSTACEAGWAGGVDYIIGLQV